MIMKLSPRPLRLDAPQGNSEARTEMYIQYIEGVLELLTQRRAKSVVNAAGYASWQDDTAGGPR